MAPSDGLSRRRLALIAAVAAIAAVSEGVRLLRGEGGYAAGFAFVAFVLLAASAAWPLVRGTRDGH